ncbi:MAG: aldolase/citrate lyase family protein [Stappiaceae bacterium]
MSNNLLKERMKAGEILAGTFIKTPAHEIIEVFAKSRMDFLTLDAEHASFDRRGMDVCLAVARALSFPALVRVPAGTPSEILKALDAGATGIVVPHVNSVEKARAVVQASHFGHGGRGFAGSTRWAGYATRPMADVLDQSARETVVIVQIEEPEAVEAAEEIAALEGVDGLFVGPADLAVCYGVTDPAGKEVRDAMRHVANATQKHNKTLMTFAPNAAACKELQEIGVTMFYVASEHSFMLSVANDTADSLHSLG